MLKETFILFPSFVFFINKTSPDTFWSHLMHWWLICAKCKWLSSATGVLVISCQYERLQCEEHWVRLATRTLYQHDGNNYAKFGQSLLLSYNILITLFASWSLGNSINNQHLRLLQTVDSSRVDSTNLDQHVSADKKVHVDITVIC